MVRKTLKEEFTERFKTAKEKVGSSWRRKLAESDGFFNSLEGAAHMEGAAGTLTKRPMAIDKLIRVTKALEKVAGIEHEPIV